MKENVPNCTVEYLSAAKFQADPNVCTLFVYFSMPPSSATRLDPTAWVHNTIPSPFLTFVNPHSFNKYEPYFPDLYPIVQYGTINLVLSIVGLFLIKISNSSETRKLATISISTEQKTKNF